MKGGKFLYYKEGKLIQKNRIEYIVFWRFNFKDQNDILTVYLPRDEQFIEQIKN